jgi:type IV fimbrial biogenesis protein FimT
MLRASKRFQILMNRNAGFTLIELIVTMALAAIILTIGVPSFRETLQNNHRATQTNEIISSFNIARSEAVKRGVQVRLCKSSDGATCNSTACDTGTGSNCWEQGWIVFADSNTNGSLDSGEIINVHSALGSNLTLRSGSAYTDWVAYAGNGTSSGNGSASSDTDSNRTFRICDKRGVDQARFAVINITGRLTIRQKQSGDSCP